MVEDHHREIYYIIALPDISVNHFTAMAGTPGKFTYNKKL